MEIGSASTSSMLDGEWLRWAHDVAPALPPEPVVPLTATVDVAQSRDALMPRFDIPLSTYGAAWPGARPGFVSGATAEDLAADVYGDAALAGLLIPLEHGFLVRPGALSAEARQAYGEAVAREIELTVRSMSQAWPELGAMQEVLLDALRVLPHPDAQERLLDALGARLGISQARAWLTAENSPKGGAVLGALLSAQARVGPLGVQTVARARDRILDSMESFREGASRDTAELFAGASAEVQAVLLREVSAQHEAPGMLGLARFGEPTPVHMMARLFESMTEPDRLRALQSLQANGVLDPGAVALFSTPRPVAARAAPMLTWYAAKATEDYAQMAEEGIPLAWFAGSLAAAFTPEAMDATVLTMAGATRGPAVAAAFAKAYPRLAGVLGAAGTVGSAVGALSDLKVALTDRDPDTGRALTKDERVRRFFMGGSGVVMTAGGVGMFVKAGRVMRYRMRPEDLHELYRTHEVVMKGERMEVFMPKGKMGPFPGAAPKAWRGPGPLAPATGGASAQQLKQIANEVAGQKVTEQLRGLDLGLRTKDVQLALGQVLRGVATQAYASARAQGHTHKKASRIAHREATKQARPTLERLTQEAVALELETRIQDGSIFDRAAMSPAAVARLQAYRDRKIGTATRALARKLGRADVAEAKRIMAQEVAEGRATRRQVQIPQPSPQMMTIWETTDGAVVRLKPLGDSNRSGPTLSVEIKSSAHIADSGQRGIAFKLDRGGRALPKNDFQSTSPFPEGSKKTNLFQKIAMDAVHWTIDP